MNHQCDWSHSTKGDPLWLSDPDEGYVEATLVAVQGDKGDKVIVETKDGKRYTVDAAPPPLGAARPSGSRPRGSSRDPGGARRLLPRSQPREKEQHPHGIENMDDLYPLNEATILSNIEHRFRLDYIYTRTGPILIAMNPFKWQPIYGPEMVQQYHAKPYGMLPPHCYQEAEDAFQQLQRSGHNQSVVICGDSGAGKTETTKLMLRYISIVARDGQETSSDSSSTIGERLVQSNPLMEAFGNAKTLRNNNSSRFGKFTLLNFRRPAQQQHHSAFRGSFPISGGRISNFLLEKSRVVRQQPGERNFHIFYQLLEGCEPDLRTRLHLPTDTEAGSKAEEGQAAFFYLSTSGCSRVEGMDDARDFASTRAAMDAVGIARAEQDDLFQLVAGVLHLGNVDFSPNADGEESSVMEAKKESLRLASELLGLDPAALAEALTTRVRQLPGEKTVRSPQTDAQSRDSRDALAKAVYNRLFDLLVARLNAAFDKDPTPNASFIGLLDVFGFEDMQVNSFEQLLINFTNEKLQLLFNEATFKMEEEEYMREHIEWDRTDFPDNQPCVDLIEKKPLALLPILDSECTRGAAASDAALVCTYNRSFRDRAHYGVCGPSTAWRKRASGGMDELGLGILGLNLTGGGNARDSLASTTGPTSGSHFTSETDFVVVHYAGPVIYSSQDFVEKNRDALYDHVATLMGTASSNALVTSLFRQAPGDDATTNALRAGSVTVAQRFTAQLNSLIQTLQGSNVRFVRCVKSNHQLEPQRMDKPSVLSQLVCSGVMAALEVRRAGFPTRVHYQDFVREFRVFSVGFPTKEHERGEHERRLKEHRSEGQLQAAAVAAAPKIAKEEGGGSDGGAHELTQEDARALTARMMLHPAVLEAVSARQYRLGVSKLFLQADTLAVLQSVRNRMILPQVRRLQRWWIRLSESALAHKLKRAAGGLMAARERAELAGAHHAGSVHRALQECEAAVQYARGLGSLHPDVFRPAVNKACQKVQALEDLLLRTLAAKEREAQQRAELLELLDKGRAHLAHVQQGLRGITVPEGAAVRKLADRASQGLRKRSQELLRLAKEPGPDEAGAEEEEGDREAALRLQRREAEEVLGWIKEAEQAFERVAAQQRKLEEARTGATEKLATVRGSLRQATKAAEAADVQGAVAVQQQLAAAREQMQAAEEAVAGSDAAAFGHAVERVRLTVSELGLVVVEERRRKEDEDLRREGQAHLDEAGKRLQSVKAEATAAGVKQALAGALKTLESELAAAAALSVGSDAHAYVAACRTVAEEGVEMLVAALKSEKLAKQKNDEQRDAEAARLAPRAAALQEVQAAIHTQFELASEEELCRAVAAAVAALGGVKAALAKSPAVSTLRARVDAALLQATEAERLFAEVRQRHEFRARELESARAQHESLGRRFKGLLAPHGLGEEGRGGGDQEEQVLAALTADAMARVQERLGALERDIRQWSGSPEDALRVCTLAASEALDELEAVLQAQQQRLELVGKVRQDEAARLKLAKDRFQAFLVTEVYEPAGGGLVEGEGGEEAPVPASATTLRLGDKAGVRATIAATEAALRRAEERVRGPVSLAWLEREEASRLEEQRMVSEAVAKVEEAQAFLAEERRRHERWLRQSRANQASAEAARAGLGRLREQVEASGVGHVRSVRAAVEACEAAQDLVAKLLAQSTRRALDEQRQQQEQGPDEKGPAARDGLALQMERAIATLAAKVKDAVALVESCRAQREVEEVARAETQARFEAVLLQYQGVVGMVEAAGPVVKKLCQGCMDEATATVNQAAHWVRRGTAAAAGPAEDGGATVKTDAEEVSREESLAQLAARVAEAAAQVDVLEAEAQAASSRVERATRLRVSEGKRLAALDETLALCRDKAEKRGVHRVTTVAGPLRRAREALVAAKLKLDGDLLEMWGDMTAGVMAQAEEAARLVGELEELLDREAQTRERAEREVASTRRTFVGLTERHTLAKRTAEEGGVAHVAAVAAVVSAADAELGAVRQAMDDALARLEEGASVASSGLSSLLEALAKSVAQEEAAVDEEARRLRARETEAQQAARELACLVERMDRVELVLRAASLCTDGGDSGSGAPNQPTKEKGEGETQDKTGAPQDAAAGVAAVLVAAPHVREALEKAKDALQRLQRSVANDAAGAAIPSTEAAMTLVQAAEEAVQEEAVRLRGARQRRAEAEQRLRFLERKFTDLQEEAGRFCARSAHMRVQLEAGVGEGQRCWWGTQTGASQVAAGGSAASAAAMARDPITTVQLLVESVAAAEVAMGRARQRLFDNNGKAAESPEAAAAAGQALEEALLRIERAAELLEAEKSRVEREEEERLVALRSLDQLGDRVARVRVVVETREMEGMASVTEALSAAELALGVVGELLAAGRGAPSIALPAFDVARRRVQEAEEVVAWELQRKLRREQECTAAKEQLARLRLRFEALQQVVKEFGFGDVPAVRNCLEDVGQALERAELALASAPTGTTAVATVHAEVRAVGQRLEASERAVRRERIRHEERQRAAQQREGEARLRAAREADEERRKGEMEKLKRSQLDVELEKLLFRLSLHRPTLDSIQADMARAENAAKSARHRLAEGDITDAQVATETAYCLAESFEQTISTLRNGGGLVVKAIAEEQEEAAKPPPSSLLGALAPPLPATAASGGETAVAAAGFQAYMEKTTATLDTMAQSIQALMHTVADLNTSVLVQRRKLDEHSEVLASPDKILTPTRNVGADSRSRPSSAFGMDLSPAVPPTDGPTAGGRGHKASDDIGRSLAPAFVDEEGAAAADQTKGAAGMDASFSTSTSRGGGSGGGPKGVAGGEKRPAQEATAVIRDEETLRRQLRGRDGSEELYMRLARFVTRNGITIEDCIIRGSTEDNTLEVIAGDADSYTLFAPIFTPAIGACQPQYKGPGSKQPTALDPALLLPDVAEEEARRAEPGCGPGDVASVRLVVSRNLAGRLYPPKMSVEQLREVERAVVPHLEMLTGRLSGSYTSMRDVLADRALQKGLSRMGVPVHTMGSLPHWPEGRGVFLNRDRTLCIILNLEDHISVLSTAAAARSEAEGPAALAHRAFALACEAMAPLAKGLRFDFDPNLGYLTPSAAKLGTAFSCSAMLAKKPAAAGAAGSEAWAQVEVEAEKRFLVNVQDGCIDGNRATLGWSEVDIVHEVLKAARFIAAASTAGGAASPSS